MRFHGLGSEVVDRLITSDTVIKKSISNEAKEPNNLDKVPPISLSETCVSDIERPEVKEPNNVAEISDNSSLSHSGDMYTPMMQESSESIINHQTINSEIQSVTLIHDTKIMIIN